MEIGRLRSDQLSGRASAGTVSRTEELETELDAMERRWEPTRQAHQALMDRLETKVEESSHTHSTGLLGTESEGR